MRRIPIAAAVAAVACLIPLAASGSIATAASHSHPAKVTYHSTRGSVARLAHAASVKGLKVVKSQLTTHERNRLTPFRSPAGATPAIARAHAPKVAARSIRHLRSARADGGFVTHAFNGLSQRDSQNLFGPASPITPPDQGLCAGHDSNLAGNPAVIWEPVNLVAQETTPNGKPLSPIETGPTLWQDPFSTGDIRCLYDPSTQSFYFTEIGFPVATGPASDDNNTTADVVVMNRHGVAAYQFDTSLGGPSAGDCFGDQPKVGFDNNALVISTDEFCNPTESDFEGALTLVISKSQLVHENSTVNEAVLGPVSLAGNPVTGLDPAIDTGSGTEYLVNSVPFLTDGSNNSVGDTLGLWTLRNTASVTTGVGSPTLTSKVLPSENYAFPVPATSTGDGSTFTDGQFTITSETALNPDDSRIAGPVNVSDGPGGIRLWTALDAAVTPAGDSAPRDGAAWFEIDPARQRIVSQGTVAARGASLLYPAMEARAGVAGLTFTITGPKINPSIGFTTVGSRFITDLAPGTSPHQSFSDVPPFNSPRWGDYSFAVPDPDGPGMWFATEYIPPKADQAVDDNWGTFVFELHGH
jgi:hypothetical protein